MPTLIPYTRLSGFFSVQFSEMVDLDLRVNCSCSNLTWSDHGRVGLKTSQRNLADLTFTRCMLYCKGLYRPSLYLCRGFYESSSSFLFSILLSICRNILLALSDTFTEVVLVIAESLARE